MSFLLSVPLNVARAYLNDNNATVWTDPILIPKAQEAFRELTNKLWVAGCPVVRATNLTPILVNASLFNTTFTGVPALSGMQNPIALYESANPATTYTPMTEVFNIPVDYVRQATLVYWSWKQEVLEVPPCSTNRNVIITYRVKLTVPSAVGDTINIPFADLYLGARTAAIAAGSIGNKALYTSMSAKAKENLTAVVAANRGQSKALINP